MLIGTYRDHASKNEAQTKRLFRRLHLLAMTNEWLEGYNKVSLKEAR